MFGSNLQSLIESISDDKEIAVVLNSYEQFGQSAIWRLLSVCTDCDEASDCILKQRHLLCRFICKHHQLF
jgi:hypothetical protein